MPTVNLTAATFEDAVTKNDIVILDFWAAWCGPCRQFAPIFEHVSGKHPDIFFGKIDTDAEQELAGAFQVRSIPTVVVLREGIPLFAEPGALPAEALESLIEQVRALDMEEVHARFQQAIASAAGQAGSDDAGES